MPSNKQVKFPEGKGKKIDEGKGNTNQSFQEKIRPLA